MSSAWVGRVKCVVVGGRLIPNSRYQLNGILWAGDNICISSDLSPQLLRPATPSAITTNCWLLSGLTAATSRGLLCIEEYHSNDRQYNNILTDNTDSSGGALLDDKRECVWSLELDNGPRISLPQKSTKRHFVERRIYRGWFRSIGQSISASWLLLLLLPCLVVFDGQRIINLLRVANKRDPSSYSHGQIRRDMDWVEPLGDRYVSTPHCRMNAATLHW